MSTTYISTAICHVFTAGASIWAIKSVSSSAPVNFPVGTFGSFIINSAFGVLTYAIPKLRKIYRHTLFVTQCVGLPCIVTEMCYKYATDPEELAYLPLGFAAVPLIVHLTKRERDEQQWLDAMILGNLIAVGYFSFMNTNYYGYAMIASYALNHFVIGTLGSFQDTDIPALDLYMIGLCFFDFFTVKALSE